MSTKTQSSDLLLRDDPDMTPDKFIQRYCEVFREHASATVDDSLNEFEKLITIVLDNNIAYKNVSNMLGLGNLQPFEMRDILEGENANHVEYDEETVALRETIRKLVFRVTAGMMKDGDLSYADEEVVESMAKLVTAYHLVFRL